MSARVRAVRAGTATLPLPAPLRLGPVVVTEREYAAVEVETEDGLVGKAYCLTRNAPVAACVERLVAPVVIGRDADPATALGGLHARDGDDRPHGPRRAGDRARRHRPLGHRRPGGGLPLWRLLGGARPGRAGAARRRLPARGPDTGVPRRGRHPLRTATAGHLLKIARDPDPGRMRRWLEAAAAGLPGGARLVVDAGYGWRSSEEALAELPLWGETPLAWLEDPLVPEDAEGCAAIRRSGPHPVGVGDEVTHITTFRALLDARRARRPAARRARARRRHAGAARTGARARARCARLAPHLPRGQRPPRAARSPARSSRPSTPISPAATRSTPRTCSAPAARASGRDGDRAGGPGLGFELDRAALRLVTVSRALGVEPPQLAAADLPRHGQRQLGHELDLARDLVGREPRADELLQLGGELGRACPRRNRDDERLHDLAAHVVGDADRGRDRTRPDGGSGTPRSRPARSGSRRSRSGRRRGRRSGSCRRRRPRRGRRCTASRPAPSRPSPPRRASSRGRQPGRPRRGRRSRRRRGGARARGRHGPSSRAARARRRSCRSGGSPRSARRTRSGAPRTARGTRLPSPPPPSRRRSRACAAIPAARRRAASAAARSPA